jgi:hypothetical protein
MRQLLLCGLTLSLLALAANKNRDWRIGKVADSAVTTREYTKSATTTATTTGTISPDYGAGSTVRSTTTANTVVRHVEIDTNKLIVVGADYIYTVQDSTQHGGGLLTTALANRKHGCRFILGDDIKYAQDKRNLYVLDADGRECRLNIVRQEKALTGKGQ